jgi:hypothetical protein
VGNADEREGMAEGTTDDVEGHGLLDSPSTDQPSADRTDDEGDDVEAHGLLDRPSTDSPSTD